MRCCKGARNRNYRNWEKTLNLSNDPNIENIEHIAQALGELRNRVVLVGGAVVGILINDTNRPAPRPTIDVDLLADVTNRSEYYKICDALRIAGFKEEGGEVICRWIKDGRLLDLMPADPTILGFTNRWYQLAIKTSVPITLPSGLILRHVSAPLFITSKFESFKDRGNGDYAHHDIEDIINLIDGKSDLLEEFVLTEKEVQRYISEEFKSLLSNPSFTAQLPWHLNPAGSEQDRTSIIIERIKRLVEI